VSGFREPSAADRLLATEEYAGKVRALASRIDELEKYVAELEGRPVMQTEWEQQQARIDELEREIEGYKMGADAEAERSDEEYRLRLEAERELEIERSEHHDTLDAALAEADILRSKLGEAQHERGDWKDLYSDAVARCEQLKRERDEARAERDEAQRDLEAFVEPEGDDPWVRLDDETIEKVAWVMFALDNAGPHHRYLHDKLRHCLRELRDGELGGGE